MGSKEQLLKPLWQAIGPFGPRRVLDLCSGSGVVSYMLKAQGCAVVSNDQMAMATTIAEALIVNNGAVLDEATIAAIANVPGQDDGACWALYGELYYGRADMAFLDAARTVIAGLRGSYRMLATAALIRACIKRRPRGIFTYTGNRYDDGRKDLRMDLRSHFRAATAQLNPAVFDNGREHFSTNVDLSVELPEVDIDLIYFDPPYFSPLSDNEYVRRYHFTEALARDWAGVDVQHETKTKKLRNYPNPFRSEKACVATIERVLEGYPQMPVVLSYSSNSLPNEHDLRAVMLRHRRNVQVVKVPHRYSFANQAAATAPVRNAVFELIFVAS
ncbi:MAG: DNA adenine methylase [Pseudomonadota bacterium]